MNKPADTHDAVYLSGEHIDRLREALKVAEHQARVAQSSGYGRHVEDVLVEIEEAIGSHLARIDIALDHDAADAEESGEAERQRESWSPRYRAA
jgi:hypothetical protein